jgi:hypothetical protein
MPPGQNPRRICSFEPHCLDHWSSLLLTFVARPTFRCIVFLSVGSVRDKLTQIRGLRRRMGVRTEDLEGVYISLDVARRASLLHLRAERVLRRRL